jgi:secreted PhoX family phosphatase
MKAKKVQLGLGAVSVAVAFGLIAPGTSAGAVDNTPRVNFTPITANALPCSASGFVQFANDSQGDAVTPAVLMTAGEPATPINAPATSNKVGRENDMIALSAGGKYLYTVSENANPSDTGAPNGSDGLTRLTLKGKDAGKKQILADDVDASGNNLWQRVDGIKSYPFGGPADEGVLLASEEFATGGIWQIDPQTGAFTRLNWLGNYAHEGIGLDDLGNLYVGDENRTGAIYKAVPSDVSDLTKGGTLYYMVGTGTDASGWKAVVNPVNATPEASAGGAILFDRPEDFDERNGRIYFTVTEPAGDAAPRHGAAGQIVNGGGVYSISATGVPEAATQSGSLPYGALTPMIQLNDPTYTSQAQAQAQQGLQFPDNLAFDGNGNLWVHEDIPDGNGSFPASGIDVSKQTRNQQDELYAFVLNEAGDAIIANADSSGPGVSGGYKAADMRTSPAATPCQNEFTGGIFGNDGRTLFINQQHAENATLTIRLK